MKKIGTGTVYTCPVFFSFDVCFHNSCSIFLHFESSSNDYLVLHIALRSSNQIKPSHLFAFITEAKLCLFLLFPIKQSGKHFPKNLHLDHAVFYLQKCRSQVLGCFFFFLEWIEDIRRGRNKIPKQTTNKTFLAIFFVVFLSYSSSCGSQM